jgi:hypothetical protein
MASSSGFPVEVFKDDQAIALRKGQVSDRLNVCQECPIVPYLLGPLSKAGASSWDLANRSTGRDS